MFDRTTFGSRRAAVIGVLLGLVALSCAELAVRRFAPQNTRSDTDRAIPACFRADSTTGWSLLPGSDAVMESPEFKADVHINGDGLRMDGAVSRSKPPGRRRVVILGDGFAFGWGVSGDRSFPSLLSRHLAARPEPVDVVNLGLALGPSPDSYLAALKKGTYEADVVVVALNVDKDLTIRGLDRWEDLDDQKLPGRVIPPFRMDRDRVYMTPLPPVQRVPVLNRSQLFVLLWNTAGRFAGRWNAPPDFDQPTLSTPYLYQPDWPEWLESSFQDQVRCLVGLRDLARSRGQEFLVMMIPSIGQIYHFEVNPDTKQLDFYVIVSTQTEVPQSRLRDALGAAGVPVFDLISALTTARDPNLYFFQDGHFAERGHEVTAAALESELDRLGWLR